MPGTATLAALMRGVAPAPLGLFRAFAASAMALGRGAPARSRRAPSTASRCRPASACCSFSGWPGVSARPCDSSRGAQAARGGGELEDALLARGRQDGAAPPPRSSRKFRPLVERTWAGPQLPLPRRSTSSSGAARWRGFRRLYQRSLACAARTIVLRRSTRSCRRSEQHHAKNARF